MRGHIRKVSSSPNRWIARHYLGQPGRYKSRTFTTRRDAEEWLTLESAGTLTGTAVDRRAGEVAFRAEVEGWDRSRRHLAPATLARDRSVMASLVLPHLGGRRLADLSVPVLDGWVAGLEAEGLAPATIRKAFMLVASVLDRAALLNKIPRNPARIRGAVSLPTVERKDMRVLEPDEVASLADAIEPRWRALVLTAAYTGCRWGELAGLRARNLDLSTGRLSVVATLSEVGGELAMKEPKTASSRRTVALPAGLVDELRAHLDEWPAVADGLVFTGTAGAPLRRTNWRRRVWLPAVQASVGPPLRFHDLRHTHAAWLIAQGAHAKVIADRLGHASPTVTMNTYAHLLSGMDEAAAERLDELFTAAPRTAGTVADLGR